MSRPPLCGIGELVAAHLASRLRQNNPTGRFPLSSSGKSVLGLPTSCPRGRGVGHRHERWDGMRWTQRRRARDGMAGRASGPVSDPRTCGRAAPKRTVKSCGPDASAVGVKSAKRRVGPTGRRCASYSQATETTKPDSPGRARSKP
jgi:hypothetical protein